MEPGENMAMLYSGSTKASGWGRLGALVGLIALLNASAPLCAAPPPKQPADIPMPTLSAQFADSAQVKLISARKRFQADTNSIPAAWALGEACFWRAEFATNATERTQLANEGIAVCRAVTLRSPTVPEGHYYLAMNLGQLARTKWFEALGLVKDLEMSLNLASGMQPRLDHAGPDRCLGLLYRDAPGWPLSVGSKSKARQHLLKSVALAPEFPENHLILVETWLQWREKKTLQRDLDTLAQLLPKARAQLTGEAWAAHWDDWDRRWQFIQADAAKLLRK